MTLGGPDRIACGLHLIALDMPSMTLGGPDRPTSSHSRYPGHTCCPAIAALHAADTKCSLAYARRCAALEDDHSAEEEKEAGIETAGTDAAADGDDAVDHKAIAASSPMANDEFDEDEEANRQARKGT